MAYRGTIIPIKYGELGLTTDVSQIVQDPRSLLLAKNVSLRLGSIETEPGSTRWNQTVLPAGIAAFADWWPTPEVQRVMVACKNGQLYRFTDKYNSAMVTAGSGAPAVLNFSSQTQFVTGGSEAAGSDRKLFVFSGNDQVQVIAGDASVRESMTRPALDWTDGNYPQAGISFNGALWAFGNKNNPHALYRSSITDQEDFQTVGAYKLVNVFPGDSDKIICAFVYKTRLFVLKHPFGLYYVDDTDPSAILVYKLGDSFGGSTANCAINVLDDMLIRNSTGSITSLAAVQALGQAEQGDLLKMLMNLTYMQENTNPAGTMDAQAIYYEDKKQAIFSYRSPSGSKPDRMLKIDYHSAQPRATWTDKDQPNCLGLIRDLKLIPRPYYGAEDGYLYEMDNVMRNVGGAGYTSMFQTPYLDFGFADSSVQEKDKIFDFIALPFESMGKWPIYCDVFIDNRFVETLQFSMSNGVHLDGAFTLDRSRLGGPGPFSRIQPVHGMGKRISLRFYMSTVNQKFKIPSIDFYFRVGGQNNK